MCTRQGRYVRTLRMLVSVHWWIDLKNIHEYLRKLTLGTSASCIDFGLLWHFKLRLDSHRCQGHGDFAGRYPNLHWGGCWTSWGQIVGARRKVQWHAVCLVREGIFGCRHLEPWHQVRRAPGVLTQPEEDWMSLQTVGSRGRNSNDSTLNYTYRLQWLR